MKHADYYHGREQTYLKHLFLDRYLERVAYKIGSFSSDFVYVDGFSGPWRSRDEAFEDTSFVIALNKLRQVRSGLARIGRRPRIRCLFVEKSPDAFRALESAVRGVTDIEVQCLCGRFEELIPAILRWAGRSFSLVFIDPTGWTGFGLHTIAPILRRRGEVLVNFMFDHINRFLDDPRPETAASFSELFGGPGWEAAVRTGDRREETVLDLYRERMRSIGGFKHVTSTRILKPLSDRAYFHLVYGTRHVKGLIEFREVERRTIEEQENVRLAAKQTHRVAQTRQQELFAATSMGGPRSFEQERAKSLEKAASLVRALLRGKPRIKYEDALAAALETPLVWDGDVKRIVVDMRAAGEIEVEGLKPRERTPKPGHVLVRRTR